MPLRDRLARQAEPEAQAESRAGEESANPSSTQWLTDFLTREGILVETPPAEEAPKLAEPPRPRPVLLIGPPLAGAPRAAPRLAVERSAIQPRSEPRLGTLTPPDGRPRAGPILLSASPLAGRPAPEPAPPKPFLPEKRRRGRAKRRIGYWVILGLVALLVAAALLVIGAPRVAKTVAVTRQPEPPARLAMNRPAVNQPPAVPPQHLTAAPPPPAVPLPPAPRARLVQPPPIAPVTAASAAAGTPLHLKIVYTPAGTAEATQATAVADMLQSGIGGIAGVQVVPGWVKHGLVIYFFARDREAASGMAASLARITQAHEPVVPVQAKSPPAPGFIEILLPLKETP